MNFHNHVIVQSVHFFLTHRPVPARCVCLPIGIPFTPVGGLLGGILGRRKIILFCQPFGLLSWLIMANAQNVSTLLIARFLSSVAICCQASPGNYRINELIKPQYLNSLNRSGLSKRCLAHFVLIFEAILCNKKANCCGINRF